MLRGGVPVPRAHDDAERLDNLLPPDRLHDAVVVNPLFSATGGRVNGHNTQSGARHVEQALLRLKAGGRLVSIIVRGMAPRLAAVADAARKDVYSSGVESAHRGAHAVLWIHG